MAEPKKKKTVVQKIRDRLLNKKNVSQASTVTKTRNQQNKIIEDAFGTNWKQ